MALSALSVHTIAEEVLACVCEALAATAGQVDGYPGCPCRVCVVPGAPAWDSCTDCDGGPGGQLTVHVARIYPSRNFPAPEQGLMGVKGCQVPPVTAAELVVTLLRCVPGVHEDGCPPTCEELAEAARIVHIDVATVFSALMCCLPGTGRRGRRFVMGEQRIIGPQGHCAGVEQRVTVALPGCGTCPDPS